MAVILLVEQSQRRVGIGADLATGAGPAGRRGRDRRSGSTGAAAAGGGADGTAELVLGECGCWHRRAVRSWPDAIETPPVLPDAAPPASSALRDGGANVRNISLQAICPGHPADHLTIGTSDPVGYAVAVDAMDHDGPADPARIDRAVCLQLFQPGVDPATFPTDFAQLTATVAEQLVTYPKVTTEPALQPYAESSPDIPSM